LTTVLQELARSHKGDLRFSFASSSSLARQVEAGAPADIFFSANQKWMDYLQEKGLIALETRANLLGNSLVIIAPRGEGFPARLEKSFDFAAAFEGRLALGDPDHVPAGQYARQALESLGWWQELKDRLAPAPDVRGALVYVERGECPAGIVYATDAAVSSKVETIAALPEWLHDPIVYPVAAIKGRARKEVHSLLEFLHSKVAATIFRQFGFTVIEPKEQPNAQP
jgi:molybdate transport system substrate-binding protein